MSPVRTAVRISGIRKPRSRASCRISPSGDVQILLDVVAQSFQRRDVQDFGLIEQVAGEGFAHQHVNAGEERRQSLAGTGGSADQRSFFGENVRPTQFLRFRGRAEFGDEPLANERVRPFQRVRFGRVCNGNVVHGYAPAQDVREN